MRARAGVVLVVTVAVVALACAQGGAKAQVPATAADGAVVATFGGQSVTQREAEALAGGQLVKARQEQYALLAESLRKHAFEVLQEREATRLGISREELVRREVAGKVGEPAREEVDRVLQQYRSQLPPDEAEARKQVLEFLSRQGTQTREAAYRAEVLAAGSFRLLLEPPRLSVPIGPGDPSTGPADAPITIVELTDFQCPYCQRVQPALNRVRAEYAGKVRLVVRHLPLPMHDNARGAAEAAMCANAQGKFWELHDFMFAHQRELGAESLRKAAAELKLDVPAFVACLEQKTFAKKVDEDLAFAESSGINGTPAFLVNGRFLEGAQPFEAFKELLDDELGRVRAAAEVGGR